MNAATFYKALSYACLYNAESAGIEDIYDTDTTVSIVREEKPVKLLVLRQKYPLTKKKDGIYRIGGMIFPMQILVTKELDRKSHIWPTSLTRMPCWLTMLRRSQN